MGIDPNFSTYPIVWRLGVVLGLGPNIVISVRVVGEVVFAALNEPFVLVRRMVGYEIHDDVHSSLMKLLDKLVKVIHRSVLGIDVHIGCHIISAIFAARWVDWIEPDGRDAKVREVIELGDNSFQVANSVVVRVFERFGVDLVDDTALPPFESFSRLRIYEPSEMSNHIQLETK